MSQGNASTNTALPVRVRVSICGVRNDADVDACVRGGADGVGVIVLTSHVAEDAVDLELAEQLLQTVPPYISRYAVTHTRELDRLLQIADSTPVDTIQLHEAVTRSTILDLKSRRPHLRLIKAIHVDRNGLLEAVEGWEGCVNALLFDSINRESNQIGGTGLTHDWRVTAGARSRTKLPIVLAGGLTPGNVAAAVRLVKPWSVNLNSGVETDGYKDLEKIVAFIQNANAATAESLV